MTRWDKKLAEVAYNTSPGSGEKRWDELDKSAQLWWRDVAMAVLDAAEEIDYVCPICQSE